MNTKKHRINVTLTPDDTEVIHIICKKKNISMSELVRKVVEDWLEDYEDMLLARRVEKIEEEWIKDGMKTISGEEVWKKLDLE